MKRIHLLWTAIVALSVMLTLAPAAGEAAYTYAYDEAGRLTRVTLSDGSKIVYAYDTAGNVLLEAFSIRRSLNEAISVLKVLARVPDAVMDAAADATADGQIGLDDAVFLLQKLSEVRP